MLALDVGLGGVRVGFGGGGGGGGGGGALRVGTSRRARAVGRGRAGANSSRRWQRRDSAVSFRPVKLVISILQIAIHIPPTCTVQGDREHRGFGVLYRRGSRYVLAVQAGNMIMLMANR
jgi:hypothetical protein